MSSITPPHGRGEELQGGKKREKTKKSDFRALKEAGLRRRPLYGEDENKAGGSGIGGRGA